MSGLRRPPNLLEESDGSLDRPHRSKQLVGKADSYKLELSVDHVPAHREVSRWGAVLDAPELQRIERRKEESGEASRRGAVEESFSGLQSREAFPAAQRQRQRKAQDYHNSSEVIS